MFPAKCLLPRLDRLLHVRSCLQNFYQCLVDGPSLTVCILGVSTSLVSRFVKTTVSDVPEDLTFKISEDSDQN